MVALQKVLECSPSIWTDAARHVFASRRSGITLKNPIDALIAQTALVHSLTIVHDDQDFELVAKVRTLALHRFRPQEN